MLFNMNKREDSLRYIGRFLNRIPIPERKKKVPDKEDLFGLAQVVQRARKEAGIDVDENGIPLDISGAEPRSISFREYTDRLGAFYIQAAPAAEAALPEKPKASLVESGTVEVPATDGGPTIIMRKVDAPTVLENLAKELNLFPAAARAALADNNIFDEGYAFYRREEGKNVPVAFEEALRASREYFASLESAVEERVAVPAETAPLEEPQSLEDQVRDVEDITDAVTLEPPEEILDPKEKYLGPLAQHHNKPVEDIERVLGEQKIQLAEEGKFYRTLPERDGQLKGEEVALSEVNDILGSSFAVERLPIVVEEKKVEVAAPTGGIPSGSDKHVEKKWLAEGDATPVPETNGIEKVLAEMGPAIKPEDVVKRSWPSYVAGGVAALVVAGAVFVTGYFIGRANVEPPQEDKKSSVDNLERELVGLQAELETARVDNDNLLEGKRVLEEKYGFCAKGLEGSQAALEKKSQEYAALEQRLATVPPVSEFGALQERNAALEAENEQASIKAQEAEGKTGVCEAKYEECTSAKDTCESARKTEMETCSKYSADLETARKEREQAQAERDGMAAELGECLIAAGTPAVVEKIVEKEVPIEVEKVVEKEVVKYLEKECPVATCSPATECLGAEVVCQEVRGRYDACVAEREAGVQTQEETTSDLAVCGMYKGVLQAAYDGCVGELGAAEGALKKKQVECANANLTASAELRKAQEQLAQAQQGGEQCKKDYQTLEARTAGSNYERIRADPTDSSKVAEGYIQQLDDGAVIVKGRSCDEALGNLYALVTGNINDAALQQVFVENTRGICSKINPKKNYIQIKVKK